MLRILCPVDFSVHSKQALRHAASLAARGSGQLIVLFVEDRLLFAASAGGEEKAALEGLRSQLRRFVAKTLTPAHRVFSAARIEVAVGEPAEEIQRVCRKLRCDLIVVGSHGLTGATRLLLGSTTEKVLRNASVPVMAVPPQCQGRSRLSLVQARREA